MMKTKFFLFSLFFAQALSKALVENSADEMSASEEIETADKRIIMPGTKWCGMGNKAENDDDLGSYIELDKCCRSHDKCKKKVNGFSKEYGYRNWFPFTVSDCQCDEKFYDCMKDVRTHTAAAKIVGNLFFNILSMPCLEFNEDGTKATKGSSPGF